MDLGDPGRVATDEQTGRGRQSVAGHGRRGGKVTKVLVVSEVVCDRQHIHGERWSVWFGYHQSSRNHAFHEWHALLASRTPRTPSIYIYCMSDIWTAGICVYHQSDGGIDDSSQSEGVNARDERDRALTQEHHASICLGLSHALLGHPTSLSELCSPALYGCHLGKPGA